MRDSIIVWVGVQKYSTFDAFDESYLCRFTDVLVDRVEF